MPNDEVISQVDEDYLARLRELEDKALNEIKEKN